MPLNLEAVAAVARIAVEASAVAEDVQSDCTVDTAAAAAAGGAGESPPECTVFAYCILRKKN